MTQACQRRGNLQSRIFVQISGRFIGQNQVRFVNDRTGDCYALLLSSRQGRRIAVDPLFQSDSLNRFESPLTTLGLTIEFQREHHIFLDRQ